MSWYATGQAAVNNGTVTYTEGLTTIPESTKAECQKSLESAKAAVQKILESGVLGEGDFNVSMNGHANTGNVKTPGFANDSLNIGITQI